MRSELESRKKRNPSYSLRAFSRQIGLPAPVISEIFSRKREIPVAKVPSVLAKLNLTEEEQLQFMNSVRLAKTSLRNLSQVPETKEIQTLEEDRHEKVIAEWEYFAVTTLLETAENFQSISQIAKRLALTPQRAEEVITNLQDHGLIGKNEWGFFYTKSPQLESTQDISSAALKKSHVENMQLAAAKLYSLPVEERYFSSSTIAVDKNRLEELKALYREFRDKLGQLMANGEPKDVFHVCFQAYPVTVQECEDE